GVYSGSQKDDWNPRPFFVLLDYSADFVAGQTGHHNIEHDQVRIETVDKIDCLHRIGAALRVNSLVSQHFAYEFTEDLIVVHCEHSKLSGIVNLHQRLSAVVQVFDCYWSRNRVVDSSIH